MLVRWLCSSPASELLPLVGRSTSFFPGLRKCTPRQQGHVNQQAASFQRPPKRPAQVVLLSLDWARNAPYYLDKVRVQEGAVGPSFSQTATSRVPGYGGDLQNEKKQRQRQATPSRGESPTGNHQITKLGDDQERRPFPKWRNTKGRELLASTKKTQWMRTAKKVKHRKPAPPMRKNRPEQKTTKKTETASKTGANEKTYP